MSAAFAADVIKRFDETKIVEIETVSPKGTKHSVPIWIVVVDGVPYVRSVRGPKGRWYRELLANGEGAIVAEIEHLGLEDHRRDARGTLEGDIELADELVLRQRDVVVGDLTHGDLAQLVERDLDRPMHVLRVDAHPHDPGRLPAARADAAEDVVGEAELIADHVARTACERVGGVDHVRHARGRKARVRPR